MRHEIDVPSLLFGLLFAAAAVAGLNGWFRDVLASPELWEPEVVVAIALVALGLLLGGLIATLLTRRRRRERRGPGGGDDPASGTPRRDPDGAEPSLPDRDRSGTHADA